MTSSDLLASFYRLPRPEQLAIFRDLNAWNARRLRTEHAQSRNEILHQLIAERNLPTRTAADWRAILNIAQSLHPVTMARRPGLMRRFGELPADALESTCEARTIRLSYFAWLAANVESERRAA